MPGKRKVAGPPSAAIPVHVRALCRDYTAEGVQTIVEIMRDKATTPAVRLHAACALLDRGWPMRRKGSVGYEDQYGDPDGTRLTVTIRNIVEGKDEEVVPGRRTTNGHVAPMIEHDDDDSR